MVAISEQVFLLYNFLPVLNLTATPQICIIDKSRAYRRIVEGLLRALGYSRVETFECSQDILDLNLRPDILIIDHESGDTRISGLDFFRLYGTNKFSDTKFIFLSSNTDLNIAVSAIRLGAFDYILKSKTGLERLASRLEKLVKLYKSNYRRTLLLRRALVSLGMTGLILLMAILFYLNS